MANKIILVIIGFAILLFTNHLLGFRAFIVGSGSMRPTINPGDLIIVEKTKSIKPGDIVTFEHSIGQTQLVTHRAIKIKNNLVYTRGDANNIPDQNPTSIDLIFGKVLLKIPYLGTLFVFARTFRGALLLVGLPTVYVIVSEFLKILQEIKKREPPETIKGFEIIQTILLISFAFIPLVRPPIANAYYTVNGVLFQVTLNTVTNSSPFSPQPGDVVINELMWPGSSLDSNDEWIELRNTTNHDIDIGNWQLTKWVGGTHEELMLTIPSSKIIPANGLFLIAKLSSDSPNSVLGVTPDQPSTGVTLSNTALQVRLFVSNFDSGGLLIDTAGNKLTPLKGTLNTGSSPKKFYSMERNNTPGDGTVADNWHTASTSVNFDSGAETENRGTPKSVND